MVGHASGGAAPVAAAAAVPGMPLFNPAHNTRDSALLEEALAAGVTPRQGKVPSAHTAHSVYWETLACQALLDPRARFPPCVEVSRAGRGRKTVVVNRDWHAAYGAAWQRKHDTPITVTDLGASAAAAAMAASTDGGSRAGRTFCAVPDFKEVLLSSYTPRYDPLELAAAAPPSSPPGVEVRTEDGHVTRWGVGAWNRLVARWEADQRCTRAQVGSELASLRALVDEEDGNLSPGSGSGSGGGGGAGSGSGSASRVVGTRSRNGGGGGGGEVTLEVERIGGDGSFGFSVSAFELILVALAPSSPAARGGAGRYIGRRILEVDGAPVASPQEAWDLCRGKQTVQLTLGEVADRERLSCEGCMELTARISRMERRVRAVAAENDEWWPDSRRRCGVCKTEDLMPWVERCPQCGAEIPPSEPGNSPPHQQQAIGVGGAEAPPPGGVAAAAAAATLAPPPPPAQALPSSSHPPAASPAPAASASASATAAPLLPPSFSPAPPLPTPVPAPRTPQAAWPLRSATRSPSAPTPVGEWPRVACRSCAEPLRLSRVSAAAVVHCPKCGATTGGPSSPQQDRRQTQALSPATCGVCCVLVHGAYCHLCGARCGAASAQAAPHRAIDSARAMQR